MLGTRDTRLEGLELLQAWITGCMTYQHNPWNQMIRTFHGSLLVLQNQRAVEQVMPVQNI